MLKFFDLCQIRNVPLPGNETATNKKSMLVYISPKDSLRRLLGDSTVFDQYLESGTPDERYQGTLGDLTSLFPTFTQRHFCHVLPKHVLIKEPIEYSFFYHQNYY
jgi:hypothetical protein